MLQLSKIRKSYVTSNFTQTALDDVSISFRDNEFVAILGPSGSGKTTLLNIVGGLDHYDSGDLVIDGISTKKYKDRDWDAYRNNRIGFVFQSYNLIPHQTVLANVELALTLSGVNKEERIKRATEALEKVGLGDHIDKRPAQLSGGQMQRVAIARALINDPDILLADEPTGALDSKTSVQIMDLLSEIAHDRLVVMVTHNPELAQTYANRIVELHDGVVVSDTNPYLPEDEQEAVAGKKQRYTSMGFKTALSLSFNNLMTKKGRTIMTAFAGSIGIIGIAAILALANGVNDYIYNVEEETLSEYPLQITSSGFSLGSLSEDSDDSSDSNAIAEAHSKTTSDSNSSEIRVNRIMTGLLSSIGNNDLKSLKKFLDTETTLKQYVNAIEYKYNVQPQIYLESDYGLRKVNPDSSLSAFGMGSSSSNSIMSTMYSTDVFSAMPTESSLYEGQYDILAGKWATNSNECVLVLSRGGSITDFMLYSLGKRDPQEISDMIKQFMAEEKIETPEINTQYSYDDFLGITYKVVNAADMYEYDSLYGVWKDKSDNTDYVKSVVSQGKELKIVGVVKPKEDSKIAILTTGICYPASLITDLMAEADTKQIVKDQLAKPLVDVITGKTFEELEKESAQAFDMSQMFTIDKDVLATAFNIDRSKITIDQQALGAAVMSAIQSEREAGALKFSEPSAEEVALGLSDTGVVSVSQCVGSLFLQYLVSHPAEVSALIGANQTAMTSIPNNFAQWVLTSTTPVTGSEYTPKQLLSLAVNSSAFQGSALTTYLTRAVTEYTTSLTGIVMAATAAEVAQQVGLAMAQAMSIDTTVFSSAFKFNLSSADLTEVITSLYSSEDRTYEGNLNSFGYASLDNPSSINIYPKDFEAKDKVKEILDGYNDSMKAAGEDDKVINYTDIVGALMSSVTTIIDMISAVLIAFVSISLIVSSIMIGVITYISVLERIKEIGILRAIGASKRDISRIFNAETIIEGFVSGVLGVLVTAILCIPANMIIDSLYDVPNLAHVPIEAAIVLIIISVLLSCIAGIIPSRSAAKKDPVEALRSE